MDEQARLRNRQLEKDDAMAAIWEAVNAIEVTRRQPDLWERLCLVRAFQGIFSGCYQQALTEARLAMVPSDHHVPYSQLPSDPITDKADLSFLFKAARAAQEEPIWRFPHLGPIELT